MSSLENKLKFAAQNQLNVILIGHAGVGKTSVVKSVFEELGLKYLYYSASTMDPWVDFVGVPHEVTGDDGIKYLDLIRPKAFAYDDVEAIFIDEYNRAPSKIQNSVMELIQFKSINGKKFNKLKLVWAAINPSDEDDTGKVYSVEKIDPAQMDRFHFQITVPYTLNKKYFKEKYPEYADRVIEWWNALPKIQKNLVSPRRVDMALNTLKLGGDLNWVLPKEVNTKELIDIIDNGSFVERIKKCFQEKNEEKTRSVISDNDKILSKYVKCILENEEYMNYFMPFFTDEQIVALISNNNQGVIDYIKKPNIAKTRRNVIVTIVKNKSVKKQVLDEFTKILSSIDIKNQQKSDSICLYVDKNDTIGIPLENNSHWYNHYKKVLSFSNSYDRKRILEALISMKGYIYKYFEDKDFETIKNICICSFIIIGSTRNFNQNAEELSHLVKIINTCFLFATQNNIDIKKMLPQDDWRIKKALETIYHNKEVYETLHSYFKGLYDYI